jgi:60 kDa SS-A/Ro ribonucleoprotein
LCHAKPRDDKQGGVWKKLVWGRLATPDTWEVALSAAGATEGADKAQDKRTAWELLLSENKLGALALLRNLRNFREVGVDEALVLAALRAMNTQRVLPFRFLAAARYAPQWEEALELAMLASVATQAKLPGKTALLVDISGSMTVPLSRRSEMQRSDAAYGLAVLLREIAEKSAVYSFSDELVEVPARRGFALRDAIDKSQRHNGTYLGKAVEELHRRAELNNSERYDRLVVITDEQAHDTVPNPKGKGYVINVASYKNGVGYGKWMHIDGWSESVVEYIRELETTPDA